MTKILQLKFFFFLSKTAIYLSLGHHKVCQSYRRSLQFSKEAIQHFKTWTFTKYCPLLWVIFALLDPDPDSGSGSTDPIEYGSNPDPDPQPCYTESGNKIWLNHIVEVETVIKQFWIVHDNVIGTDFDGLMEKLDQGHLHRLLEVTRPTWTPGRESNPWEASTIAKSYSNR